MEEKRTQKPNYRNKKAKPVLTEKRKRIILVVLLAGSIAMNGYTVIKSGVKTVKDHINYFADGLLYNDIVYDNTHRTEDRENFFYDTYGISKDIKNLKISSKEEFYHVLLTIACDIQFNRTTNFNSLIGNLNLNSLAEENEVYPTRQEFDDFLFKYNLLNDDGSINFEAWKEYDKKVFTFNNNLEEEAKVGKNL